MLIYRAVRFIGICLFALFRYVRLKDPESIINQHFNRVVISDAAFPCDITKLVTGSRLDDDGYVIGPDGTLYDFTDADVQAKIGLDAIEILDDDEAGIVRGTIVSIIYKGDHYQLTVRTAEDEDFVLDTEYTYDENDLVGISVKPENITLTLKGEAKKYAKK